MKWNLKEAVGKSLVRRTEIAYKARLREMSWNEATKSNYYHICSSRVNAADIWRERACISQNFSSGKAGITDRRKIWNSDITVLYLDISLLQKALSQCCAIPCRILA